MVKSYYRGHVIILLGNKWVYEDNLDPITVERPCKKCGKLPTKEGYDACLGFVPGATSACCGHGLYEAYYIMEEVIKE